jgi:hypothetical protein
MIIDYYKSVRVGNENAWNITEIGFKEHVMIVTPYITRPTKNCKNRFKNKNGWVALKHISMMETFVN